MKFLDAFKAFYLFCMALGLLSAFWIFPGEPENDDKVSWIEKQGIDSQDTIPDILNLFIYSAHFVVTTISTVGFGDTTPQNFIEQIIVMIFQFLGVVMTGFLQGQLSYVMKSDFQKQMQEEDTNLEALILRLENSRKVFRANVQQIDSEPFPPTKDMLNCFKFLNSQDLTPLTWNGEFYPKLAPKDQNEVTSLIYQSVLQKFDIFFRFFNDDTFKKELVTALTPKMLNSGDKIARRGGQMKGLYFTIQGHSTLLYKEHALLNLKEGSVFGESCLLGRSSIMDHYIGSNEFLCLYLSKRQLVEICDQHPEQKSIMQRMIYDKADHYKNMIGKFFISTQNRIDDYSPIGMGPGAEELASETNGITSKKTVHKLFFRQVISNQDEINLDTKPTQNTAKMDQNLSNISAEQSKAEAEVSESCNYTSQVASIEHNDVPSFYASPALFQSTPLNLTSLKPISTQIQKPDEHQVPSIHILSPQERSQMQFHNENLSQSPNSNLMPLPILKQPPRQSIVSYLVSEDQILDPEEEEGDNASSTEEESSEEADGGDSDSDESDLDNSLEVPLESINPEFQDLSECDQILQYIDARISTFDFRIKRVNLDSREKLLQEWKNARAAIKRIEGD